MTRRKSAMDLRISRCLETVEAYRAHEGSTRQREEAAEDLGVDETTFRLRLDEARKYGFLRPTE